MSFAESTPVSPLTDSQPVTSEGKILSRRTLQSKRRQGAYAVTREECASLVRVEHAPDATPPKNEPDQQERLTRRERRSLIRQAFGTKLLTTFAILLTLVTFVVFAVSGWVINTITYEALEQQHTDRLQSVAAMAAVELNTPLAFYSARNKQDSYHQEALTRLQQRCAQIKREAKVSEVVLFDVGDADDFVLLASSAGGAETHQAALTRLYADNLAIAKAREERQPASSKMYPFQSSDGSWRNFKSGYAPILEGEPNEPVRAFVAVEIPVEFTRDVERVNRNFFLLGAIAGVVVLISAVFLVRQRVHVPVYRLVKAMQGGEGGRPRRARVRYHDEIGALTDRYNDMVDRLEEQDTQLRELYAQAQETASYLKGYSEHLVAGVPTGVVAVDPTACLTVCNPSAVRILSRGGTLGQEVSEVFGEDHPISRALLRALRKTITDQALFILDKEGGAHDSNIGSEDDDPEIQSLVELTCAPFFGEGGQLLGAVALVHDRTELERFRRAASRNERLAAIGNLGAGLAHEIKNPLSAISGFAELIERKEGADAARLAKRLRGEVSELNTFLNQFLSFTRENTIRRDATDLNQIVVRGVELALQGQQLDPTEIQQFLDDGKLTLPDGASLHVRFELDETLPMLALDEMVLRAACRNLAENAILAMLKTGGALTVRTHRINEMVFIRFRDKGPGVPTEHREKIFNPLFTTRAEGTGLGLAISNKAVTAHGGKLSVRDAPGGGAEFVIRLPVVEARVTPITPTPVRS